MSQQQNLAAGLYEVEKMRAKLVIGRLAGVIVALALWWFLVVPMVPQNVIALGVTFFVAAYAGLWLGQMATLSLLRGAGR